MPRYPRSDPAPIGPKACHHHLHSPRDPDLGSGNHDMSRLPTFAYLNDAPIHGLADIRRACSQRILGVAPSPLALAQALQYTLLATQTSAVATTTYMSRLSAFACPNNEPIHGLADIPPRRLPTDIGCGTLAPRSQTRHTQHHNFGYLRASPLAIIARWSTVSNGSMM
jgi:hypothetical protein